MKHYLTFKDGKSDKFWQIETTGKSFKVTYGKTGSVGVTQTKEFANAEKCEQEAAKLIAEKIKKGYIEKSKKPQENSKSTSYKEDWAKIVSNNKIAEAFYNHFIVLVETGEEKKLLRNLSKAITGAKIVKDQLIFTFKDEELEEMEFKDMYCSIFCNPPFQGKVDLSVPRSFKAAAELHNGIYFQPFGGGDVGFYGINKKGKIQEHGIYEPEYLEDCVDDPLLEKLEENEMSAEDVKAIAGSGQNWILFDPFRKTIHKEPAYLYLGHGADVTVPIKKADKMKFGAFLIAILSHFITTEKVFKEISN